MRETRLVAAALDLLDLPGGAAWVWLGTASATAVYVVGVFLWCVAGRGWRERAWRLVALGIAAAAADATCTWVLKPLVGRQRPCQEDAAIHAVIDAAGARCGSGASFPSNHAANTAAIAAAAGAPGLALVSLVVGADRVVLGAHHPSDVLAGWGLGAALGYGARRLAFVSRRALAQRGNPSPPAPLNGRGNPALAHPER